MPFDTSLLGRLLGRYRLEALLGQGGMADVYRAADTKLGRIVAVKVIKASHASERHFTERFLREARVVASLDHPNILPVFDFGDEDGLPFLVMPYLQGGTLRDRMTGRPFPLRDATSWIGQLADALDAAHGAGVLHRDVKPANVLLGKDGRLVLSDFGIAKLLEASTGLTVTGMVVGTPIYMAPEQAQGRPATPATDRYSLAVLAYELLAGAPPFVGETALSLLHQHVSTPAPTLTSRMPTLDPGIDRVFARALSKDPDERPPSCRALAESLADFVGGSAVSAGPPTVRWATARDTAPTALQQPAAGAFTPPPPGLTSESTMVARQEGGRGRRLALGAAGVVLGALLVLFLSRRTPAPVPAAAALPSPVPRPAPTVSATQVPAPPVAVVERDGSKAAAAEIRARQLFEGVTTALAARNLLPPAQGNALESLESLRREGDAVTVARAQELVVRALAAEAEVLRQHGDLAGARTLLLRAQQLSPQDHTLQSRLASLERDSAVPPLPSAPRPPDLPEEAQAIEGGALPLRDALEPLRARRRRLTRTDFANVLAAARQVSEDHPDKDAARLAETYAQGGLAYLERRDAEAARALAAIAPQMRRGLGRDARTRQLAFLVAGVDGADPEPWQVALAYGDARGEARAMLDAELTRRPGDARLLFGRAQVQRLDGHRDAALADALEAYKSTPQGSLSAASAEFLGDGYAQQGNTAEAILWYSKALNGLAGPDAGRVAAKASAVAREAGRTVEAERLLGRACRDGNSQACRQLGQTAKPWQRRRLQRQAPRGDD